MIVNLNEYRKKKTSKKVWHDVKLGGLCVSVIGAVTFTFDFLVTNIALIIANYEWKPALVFQTLQILE